MHRLVFSYTHMYTGRCTPAGAQAYKYIRTLIHIDNGEGWHLDVGLSHPTYI